MDQQEEWRHIPEAEGYRASSLGRVAGPRGLLKPSELNSGYLGVKVVGKGTTVHSVVLRAFVGPKPSPKHTGNHKNGDKQDNRPDNLEWMTQAENNRHAVEVLGKPCGRPAKARSTEHRQPFDLPLARLGWRDVRLEPRLGYVAWRCVDAATGDVLACKALGEMLRWVAAQVPRQLGARNLQ